MLTWDLAAARRWKTQFEETSKAVAIKSLQTSLQHCKYDFLKLLIPDFHGPRPDGLHFCNGAGKSLFRWCLSSHLLEIELRRYDRTPRENRFRSRCRKAFCMEAVGDERHVLTECLRGAREKEEFVTCFRELFYQTGVSSEPALDIFAMIPLLPRLNRSSQNRFWNGLAHVTVAVGRDIRKERETEQNAADQWATLFRKCKPNCQLQLQKNTFDANSADNSAEPETQTQFWYVVAAAMMK